MKSVQNRKALALTPKVLFKFLNNYRLTRSLQKTVQGSLLYPHPISSLFQRPFQILLLFWRYNSHAISFTHLQCASLVYTQACVTIIILKTNPFPLTVTPHSLFFLPGNHQFLSVSMHLPILNISYKQTHDTWPLVSSFFHLACFQGSPMLQHVSASFFLYLNNIPLYEHITFCLSIHLLIDSWIVSTFWLLRIILL